MGIDNSLKGYGAKTFRPQAVVILSDVRSSYLAREKNVSKEHLSKGLGRWTVCWRGRSLRQNMDQDKVDNVLKKLCYKTK